MSNRAQGTQAARAHPRHRNARLAFRGLLLLALALGLCLGVPSSAANAASPKPQGKGAEIVVEGEKIPIEGEGPQAPIVDDAGAGGQQARPVPPSEGEPAPVSLAAYLSEGGAPLTSGIVWRIFEGKPAKGGSYRLLQTIQEPQPTVEMNPGEYLVNIAYGRANLTKKIGVWPAKPAREDFVVNAGGLRINATLARQPVQAEHLLKFELFSDTQDQFGNRQKLLGDLRPGLVIRLNSGIYHVVSTYGDANSVISADVVVEPGKITEAGIDHDAAKVTLKLVQRSGGEAAADTRWTIYNAVGEVIKESAGAFPTHILAAGDYRVAAQHGDLQYASAFSVAPGETKLVEVMMQ